MRITVPLYVRQYKLPEAPAPVFYVRPLFQPKPYRTGHVLSRTMNKLGAELRKHLNTLGREAHQQELATWTMNPVVERCTLDQTFLLRRRTVKAQAMAVAFRSGSARLGLFPELDLWFDVSASGSLAARAEEVLTAHLLKIEKDEPKFDPETLFGSNVTGLLVSSIDIDVDPNPTLPVKETRPMFMLGAAEPADGMTELYRVGRLLDSLYPDDLGEAVHREREVDELSRRLADPNRPPVLLLGPRGAGKTAIIHQYIRQRLKDAGEYERDFRKTWLISPQRLISGMSYVGQWEDRLLAILKAAGQREDILYFDDMLGLYLAGQHSKSTLSAADVMRPILERREFRLLVEMTPEAYRILRERDRAMADLLEVVPVNEPTPEETRKILVTVLRQLEGKYRCAFELDAMPTVLDLQRRYVRDVAMPGKAAALLHRLAGGQAKQGIDRKQALAAFGSYSGLSTDFLDTTARLRREDVVRALSARVVGQPAAVEAMADAICVAKARLNDTSRPVSTFLFLGPTGVGKTECAKALATYLFGNANAIMTDPQRRLIAKIFGEAAAGPATDQTDRLLRFDMNEYVDLGSAGRLIGTFSDPEGLLTSAIRRQPFGVVLFDEIEKAHPAVFDLLLAVLGEGRLTDARGRTVDFTNTLIVMTSNLGVREAATSFGLRIGDGTDAEAHARYRDAAQRFFRPEFFNRIDRVVPFNRLDRGDVANIARRLMDGLLHRDGLTGRRCMLRVDPVALQRIVDAGYHPQLGARALKREVEKRIAAPVAAKLAAMPPGEPTIIDVLPGDSVRSADKASTGKSGSTGIPGAPLSLVVRVTPIRPVDPLPPTRPQLTDPAWDDPADRTQFLDDLLDRAEAMLASLEERIETLSPGSGMTQGKLAPAHFSYLALREQAKVVAAVIGRLDRAVEASTRPPERNVRKGGRPPQGHHPERAKLRHYAQINEVWKLLLAGQSFPDALAPEPPDDHHDRLQDVTADLLDELALLNAMASGVDGVNDQGAESGPSGVGKAVQESRMLLLLRCDSAYEPLDTLSYFLQQALAKLIGVGIERLASDRQSSGLSAKAGQSAFGYDESAILPGVTALVCDLPSARSVLANEVGIHLFSYEGNRALHTIDVRLYPLPSGADPLLVATAIAKQAIDSEAEPARVIRAYVSFGMFDLRTGLASDQGWAGASFRQMLLASLAVPNE